MNMLERFSMKGKILKNVSGYLKWEISRRRSFKFGMRDWKSAQSMSVGYDDPIILERVRVATLLIQDGFEGFHRDGILFSGKKKEQEFLDALNLILVSQTELNVLDFGGDLGSLYFQHKEELDNLQLKIRWNIVEQINYVNLGKQSIKDPRLHFYTDIAELVKDTGKKLDIIILRGVLSYLENCWEVLQELVSLDATVIFVDRTPFTNKKNDDFGIQLISDAIYDTSYPIRNLSKSLFQEIVLPAYQVVNEWSCEIQPDAKSEYRGLTLMRIA